MLKKYVNVDKWCCTERFVEWNVEPFSKSRLFHGISRHWEWHTHNFAHLIRFALSQYRWTTYAEHRFSQRPFWKHLVAQTCLIPLIWFLQPVRLCCLKPLEKVFHENDGDVEFSIRRIRRKKQRRQPAMRGWVRFPSTFHNFWDMDRDSEMYEGKSISDKWR